MNKIKLITKTPDAEKLIAYCARVSSPQNQQSEKINKLLQYCMKHKHWSVFEQADMTVEITTSRAIAAQLLRHRSFCFQEFSQRYSEVKDYCEYTARRQDTENRQNSIDDLPLDTKSWFITVQEILWKQAKQYYDIAINEGIAKESARFLLPLNTSTCLYMKGNLRCWLTYLLVRLEAGTQKEHRDIAKQIWLIFSEQFPIISEAVIKTYPEIFTENINE